MSCERPYCYAEAVAYIPLPEGLRRSKIYVCDAHCKEALESCFFVLSLANEPLGSFEADVTRKHVRIRGTRRW